MYTCDGDYPDLILSSGNILTVWFKTNQVDEKHEFLARYMHVFGKI